MNERPEGRPERRRHLRIAPKGTVSFDALGHEQRGRISNLSEGGVFVLTNVGVPSRLLARSVEVDVRLDDADAEWLRAPGRIIRVRPEGFALAFDVPPPGFLRMIDELTMASRARARIISIVLIDADEPRRAAMASAFRSIGCTVIEASTSLEAIVRLGESSFEPDAIAVANSTGEDARNIREFIERDHPSVKLITIGDEDLNPDGLAHWLSSTNVDTDLAGRIRDTLVAPRRRR